jgi:Flp pilus assembly protein TadD
MTNVAQALQDAWNVHQAGDIARAERAYRDVVMLHPGHATAWCYLGMALHDLRRYDEAVAAYRRALQIQPEFPTALSNLGNTLSRQGKYDEAAESCRAALRIKPDYSTAYNNLGAVLTKQGKLAESAEAFEAAIRLNPSHAPAHNNLGAVLVKQGKLEEAEARIGQSLELNPDHGPSHNNLGALLVQQGRLAEAEARLEEAVRRTPGDESSNTNLANSQLRQGKVTAAQSALDATLKVNPTYAEARKAQALIWLLLGDFERGWPAYEWRWRCEENGPPRYAQPVWDGSPLGDRTLLLNCEQGLGDTLNFIRYAQVVKRGRGGRVVFVCPPPLVKLLARTPGIDQLVPQKTAPPEFDVWAPLLSVPGILETRLETIPADIPYLFADEALVDKWRRKLEGEAGFKIGIAWQGSKDHQADVQRSVRLAEFAHLAEVPGVSLYSLQKGYGSEQIAELDGRFLDGQFIVREFDERLDETAGAFMDTAAVIRNLDLVITSDTSIAHLAGGLGVPVWTALCYSPDWRWLRKREDTPWYPSMRLFRQPVLGDWGSVFHAMAAALREDCGLRIADCGLTSAARPSAAAPPTPHPLIPSSPHLVDTESQSPLKTVRVEISPGELLDKITILEIKAERIADPAKLENVRIQLETLEASRAETLPPSAELDRLTRELKAVNEKLWTIEDEIRECERDENFGPRFIELARSVYHTNDRRAALKRQIDDLLGSRLVEEKSYEQY